MQTAEATLPNALVVPAGVLLRSMENRPDIKEALKNLKSKNALIGVEKAAYFPLLVNGKLRSTRDDLNLFSIHCKQVELWSKPQCAYL